MRGEFILVRQFPQHTTRVAHRDTVGRTIPRHNRARADYTASPHRNTAAKGNVSAYPAVIPDGDGPRPFKVGHTARFFIEKGVSILVAQGVNGG